MPPAYQMMPEIRNVAGYLGRDVANRARTMRRYAESNKEWADKIETVCEVVASSVLNSFAEEHDCQIELVTMPYTPQGTARGGGSERTERRKIGNGSRKIGCLYDTLDGTWNEKAGLRFTVSSMAAFTGVLESFPETYSLKDFSVGVVAPHHGEGLYLAQRGQKPVFRDYFVEPEEPLRLMAATKPADVRCIIDIFTAQGPGEHDRALDAVIPIMREWSDFGRYYGSIEILSLVGRSNTEPAYGGYVTARQRTDNLIPPLLVLEGAGARISDWDGNPLGDRKINERLEVAVGANGPLHEALLKHLIGRRVASS